eukprot:10716292-Alexandrium_andersonii.AAC.1
MSLTEFEDGVSEARAIAKRVLQPDIRSPDGFVIKMVHSGRARLTRLQALRDRPDLAELMTSRRALFTPVSNAEGSLEPGTVHPTAEGTLRATLVARTPRRPPVVGAPNPDAKIVVLDLCAGTGSASYLLDSIGEGSAISHIFGEVDLAAQRVLEARWPKGTNGGDVAEVSRCLPDLIASLQRHAPEGLVWRIMVG